MTGRKHICLRFIPKRLLKDLIFTFKTIFLPKMLPVMDYNMNFGETFVSLPKYMLEKDNIEEVADILIDGGVICYPTDTVWGIGCDATRVNAIQRIKSIKGRKHKNGFIILVDSIERLKKYVEELHPRIETLLEMHVRPLTIIYPKAKNLPQEVCGADGSVAIRIVDCALCQDLIAKIDAPLVSTSANLTGAPYPKIFGEISSEIIEQVDYVSKERRWEKTAAQPSTLGLVDNKGLLKFIRE